ELHDLRRADQPGGIPATAVVPARRVRPERPDQGVPHGLRVEQSADAAGLIGATLAGSGVSVSRPGRGEVRRAETAPGTGSDRERSSRSPGLFTLVRGGRGNEDVTPPGADPPGFGLPTPGNAG